MKKQYIYIVCWLVVGSLVKGCCWGYYYEQDFKANKNMFQTPYEVSYFEDEAGNHANLLYGEQMCMTTEGEFTGNDKSCEKWRKETCSQNAHVNGPSDLKHFIKAPTGRAQFVFGELEIYTTQKHPDDALALDDIIIRGITYRGPYFYEVQEGVNTNIESIVFSHTNALLRVTLTNGTVWERLP